MAGFASTVGWPLTAWGLDNLGWRETCLGWALAHFIIGIPLNASLPNTEGLPAAEEMPEGPVLALDRTMWLLAFAFAAAWAISTAMAAHLPRLLESVGASPSQALFAGILIGPAQVADVRVTTKDCDWLCVHPHSISAPTVPLCRNASPSSLASR
jgi:predicted MFS family arabinose efflux permease